MAIAGYDGDLKKLRDDPPLAPLEPDTLRMWFSVDWRDRPELEVIATAPIMTGLRAETVRHLAASWIVDEGEGEGAAEPLSIHVPDRAHCVVLDDSRPCWDCQNARDGYFTTSRHSRTIPVHDEPLAQLLRGLARVREHIAINNLHRAFNQMLDRSPVDREVSYQALVHTFGVALGAKGYDREEIHRRIGHDPATPYSSMDYAEDYVNIGTTPPWDELAALGTGEFRP